jgi:hypothetical protein
MSDARIVSKQLQSIAADLGVRLEQLTGHRVAFSLFVWTDGRASYISTAARHEVIAVLEQMLAGWRKGMPDVPAHEVD